MILGNPDSAFTVTIFSNPYCDPCRQAHTLLDQLLDEFGDGVRVIFRFSAQGSAIDSFEQEIDRIQKVFDETKDEQQKKNLLEHYGGSTPEA